jgi:hypothetical protein
MTQRCAECSRLLERCEGASVEHARIREELKNAQRHAKSEIVAALMVSEAAALRVRGDAYIALRRHASLIHEEWFSKAASA